MPGLGTFGTAHYEPNRTLSWARYQNDISKSGQDLLAALADRANHLSARGIRDAGVTFRTLFADAPGYSANDLDNIWEENKIRLTLVTEDPPATEDATEDDPPAYYSNG